MRSYIDKPFNVKYTPAGRFFY